MAVKFELPLTQNSTVVAFVCTLLVAVACTFRLELGETSLLGGIFRLVHLGSFSTWLGVQVWVTFFAGRIIYNRCILRIWELGIIILNQAASCVFIELSRGK